MFVENRTAKFLLIALLVILVVPLIVMLGMMVVGSGMMAQMGGGMMAACGLWSVLVAAALIFLVYLLTSHAGQRQAR